MMFHLISSILISFFIGMCFCKHFENIFLCSCYMYLHNMLEFRHFKRTTGTAQPITSIIADVAPESVPICGEEQFLHKQSLEMTGLTKRIVSGREEIFAVVSAELFFGTVRSLSFKAIWGIALLKYMGNTEYRTFWMIGTFIYVMGHLALSVSFTKTDWWIYHHYGWLT